MKIVQTINCKAVDDNDNIRFKIKNLIESNCSIVRLNFKNFTDKDMKRIDRILKCLKLEDENSKLDILIDIPSTKNKYRLYVEQPEQIEKNNEILICSENYCNNEKKKIKIVSIEKSFFDYIDDLNIGTTIFWGDGEGKLSVIDKGKSFLKVKAENDFFLFNNKSLSKFYENVELNEEQILYLKNIINNYNVKAIFLSFCESPNEVKKLKKLFSKIDICAKIETEKALDNLNSILRVCDGIMIARGDLALNSSLKDFLSNQNYIAKSTNAKGKKLYIATDILMSLNEQDIPSRADLCDFELLQTYSTYAIILKSSFFHKKRFSVVNEFLESVS